MTRGDRHARPTPKLNTRSSSARQAAFRARWESASNPVGVRLRRSIRAQPTACSRVVRSDSRASRRTVLRSTARLSTRRGTDMRRMGSSGPSVARRCNPKHVVEATGRVLRRTPAFTRRGGTATLATGEDSAKVGTAPPGPTPLGPTPLGPTPSGTTPPDIPADCCLDTETLAAFGTPCPDHRPTTASFHAHEKSVRALAAGH